MESLLERSNLLLNELNMIISLGPNKSSKRCLGSWVMCDIAIEHAHSLQNLMEIGNCTSAISLLRLQFDALTRSV